MDTVKEFPSHHAAMSFATKTDYTGIALVLYETAFNLNGTIGQYVCTTFENGRVTKSSNIVAIQDGTAHKSF